MIRAVSPSMIVRSLRDVRELGDELARALAGVEADPDVAEPVEPLGALRAQSFEPLHAALVARAARLDTLADPDLLLRPELVEASAYGFLGRQLLVLALLVSREIPRVGAQDAAVELDDPAGDPVEKCPVMGDEDCGRDLQQQLFQPLDALDVEVVGGLIQKQQVGLQCERQCQCRPLALAARARCRRSFLVEVKAMQEFRQARFHAPALALVGVQLFVGQAVRAGPRARAFQQALAERVGGGEFGFLFDERNAQPGALLQVAVVEMREARDDAQ
jgi:hypothetical protein